MQTKNANFIIREDTARCAIRGCIKKGILKTFLEKHGSEVENMFTLYITEEEFIDIRVEERAEERVEAMAVELAETRAAQLAETRAAQIVEEKERSIVQNIARNGIIPTEIVELTGLSENVVKRYLE